MTEAILVAVQAVSFVVIIIIMAVMANTMAMTARERYSEYATMKALGFGQGFVAVLVFAESIGIALAGGALGILLTFPLANAFAGAMGTLFPVFFVSHETVLHATGRVAGRSASWQPPCRHGARHGCASSTACGRSPDEQRPLELHRAQSHRAQADDGPDRGRHGAGRVRVRHRADAVGGARADAGGDRTAGQRDRHPPQLADGSAKRRRPRLRGDRRVAAGYRHRRGWTGSSSRRSRWCSSTCRSAIRASRPTS